MVTQSRQIQLFGLMGALVLVLFIVIFLGKDFYMLYRQMTQQAELPQLRDDQIVMESQAVDQLREMLDQEGDAMLAQYQQHQPVEASSLLKGAVDRTSLQTVSQLPDKENRLDRDHTAVSTEDNIESSKMVTVSKTEHKRQASLSADSGAETVQKSPLKQETLQQINRDIHAHLQRVQSVQKNGELTADFRVSLEKLAQKLKELPFPYSLEVEGHTRTGVAKGVSLEMARKSAAYLKRLLPAISISTVGYGDMYPISDDPKDIANTRIEIIVRRSEG